MKTQQYTQPGLQHTMREAPRSKPRAEKEEGRLRGKVALITGGDSGIGRAVAYLFAEEGARIAFTHHPKEKVDAEEVEAHITDIGGEVLRLEGDVRDRAFAQSAIEQTVAEYGRLNILINNAAVQFPMDNVIDISPEQLHATFETNIYSYFYFTQAALPHLHKGDCIINTTSVTAYRGSPHLIDYSATKGAIVAFTRSLAQNLASKSIRVNAVAPGPIWTPLIPTTMPDRDRESHGEDVPLGRTGEPNEVAPSYVFLASSDASYMTGQVLHPNGGEIVGG